jgi:hypothetical protein
MGAKDGDGDEQGGQPAQASLSVEPLGDFLAGQDAGDPGRII